MEKDIKSLQIKDWVIRYRLPEGLGPHPVIWLFHGWTGDENSMWIFASRLPKKYLLLSPRGLFSTPLGGYSWHTMSSENRWPQVREFQFAVDRLNSLMAGWPQGAPPADFSKFRIAGFSQGGAFAYAYTILNPERVLGLAGLASFMPEGAEDLLQIEALDDLPVFVAHGSKDNLVPVEKARSAVNLLKSAQAKVTYCESDVGHKLSSNCFKGMSVFF